MKFYSLTLGACAILGYIFLALSAHAQFISTATTTVHISVCGDGLATGDEVCDSGVGNNTGLYSTSTADRHCNATCSFMGPYCGDAILQPQYGEACDDGNNTDGDRCSSICQIEDLPAQQSGGGGGGGGNFNPGGYAPVAQTQVIITGKAYPDANVHILKDGTDMAIVKADGKADFYYSTTNISPGVATFGFWAQDSSGLKSAALTTTLSVVANVVTTISGEFLPPTIDLDKRKVNKGDVLTISGQAPLDISVVTHVHSNQDVTQNATSNDSGGWKVAFDTSPLGDEDFHTAQAVFQMNVGGNTVESAYSQSISFYVGQNDVGRKFISDLNNDGKVNLVDFSVLLFYWGTSGPVGDLNSDKKVDLTDFSILLFNWTG